MVAQDSDRTDSDELIEHAPRVGAPVTEIAGDDDGQPLELPQQAPEQIGRAVDIADDRRAITERDPLDQSGQKRLHGRAKRSGPRRRQPTSNSPMYTHKMPTASQMEPQ